ncbi:hypothetical protein LSH36_488g01002 [Paralvinella palmiformis]|uniref:Uncharacterized protein n=1 Tax=Paralvinella palmiformis TaxID=53620 RepID=A0AAD9JA12_9ANNE|nr:hypothetical protein LSH36_488g01002 [Paralvinella palmiformis]
MLKWYFQGRDIPKTSTRVQNSDVGKNSTPAAESPDEGRDNKQQLVDSITCVIAELDYSKWDSEESEATEPPPLPREAPPTTPPAVVEINVSPDGEEEDEVEEESIWEEENRLKKVRHVVNEVLTTETRSRKKEVGNGKKKWNSKNYNKKKKQMKNLRDDHDAVGFEVEEGRSRKLSEQCQAVDKELAELKIQKQVSRFHQSFDDEDTFHNVPDMESPRKLDFSGGGYLPAGIIITNTEDDDCLSYSSTEHEASIHDDCRSHQLVPVSFSVSAGNVVLYLSPGGSSSSYRVHIKYVTA